MLAKKLCSLLNCILTGYVLRIIVNFFYFTKQNNWNWIIPHQLLLFIALAIFLFDLILLTIAAYAPFMSTFARFICDWTELDVSEKENIVNIVITECIISAIFAGKWQRKFQFTNSSQQFINVLLLFFIFFFHFLGLSGYAIYLLHSLHVYLKRWPEMLKLFYSYIVTMNHDSSSTKHYIRLKAYTQLQDR